MVSSIGRGENGTGMLAAVAVQIFVCIFLKIRWRAPAVKWSIEPETGVLGHGGDPSFLCSRCSKVQQLSPLKTIVAYLPHPACRGGCHHRVPTSSSNGGKAEEVAFILTSTAMATTAMTPADATHAAMATASAAMGLDC